MLHFLALMLAMVGTGTAFWTIRRALALLDALCHIQELRPIQARIVEKQYAGKGSYTLRVKIPTGEIRTLSIGWIFALGSDPVLQVGQELPVLVHRHLTLPYREPVGFWLLLQLALSGFALLFSGLAIAGALLLYQIPPRP